MPFKIKQRKRGVSGWKVGQTWHRNNCSHAKSTTKIYRHCLQSEFFFLPYLRQAAKIYVSTSYSVVRQETIEISEQRTASVWFFAQEVDWCMINCDKQRLQTSVSINLSKILADHTGDWFDVKTASICTTELWDALKSFILTSLKFKVAPYPIIVSLDTLKDWSVVVEVSKLGSLHTFGESRLISHVWWILSQTTLWMDLRGRRLIYINS